MIVALYFIYIFYHCVPLLQLEKDVGFRDNDMATRGTMHLVAFVLISSMLVVCYVRSIYTDPGGIPDDPDWQYFGDGRDDPKVTSGVHETKRTGERRHCKWCWKFKPDRCHHCRVCRLCILKMDHHCPWIYNCVGHRNHKFFFLLLLNTFACTQLICWTMFDSMKRALDSDEDFMQMFTLLFGETLCGFLTILVSAFLGFHIWLLFQSMTTIEFCEKSLKKTGFSHSPYDRGVYGNIQEVLGVNPLLWFLPVSDHTSDGLTFVNEGTRLTVDLDAGRQIMKSGPRRARDEGGLLEEGTEEVLGPPPASAQTLTQRSVA